VVPSITFEGISKQVLLQIQALIESGYSVKLIVLTEVNKDVLAAFAPNLSFEKITELHRPDAYLSIRALKSSVKAARQIKHLLDDEIPKVVFAHAPYAHFLLRLAMLLGLRKKKEINLWQYFHITQYTEYPLTTWKRKLINRINKILADAFDYGHVFVSKSVRFDIQSSLLDLSNNYVIYNALPQQTNKLPEPIIIENDKATFTLLLPGRIEAAKGQLWFIEPFKKFLTLEQLKPEQVQLIIAGDGSELEILEHRIKEEKLEAFFQLTGNLPNSKLQDLIKRCSAVVLCSVVEGLPLVILEALQQRSRVLASDISPNREIIVNDKIGFLFETGNVDDCVAKLQYVYKLRNEPTDIEAIETHLAKNFSFQKHMQRLISLIENE
jgi:glycosyltransferase involved in cell wall biosynthesis